MELIPGIVPPLPREMVRDEIRSSLAPAPSTPAPKTPALLKVLPKNLVRVDSLDAAVEAFRPRVVNTVFAPSHCPQVDDLSADGQIAILSRSIDTHITEITHQSVSERSLREIFFPPSLKLGDLERDFLAHQREEIQQLAEVTRALSGSKIASLLICNDLGITYGWHVDPAVIANKKLRGRTMEILSSNSGIYDASDDSVLIDPEAEAYWSEQNEITIHVGYQPRSSESRSHPIGSRKPCIHRPAERGIPLEEIQRPSRPKDKELTVLVYSNLY